MRSVKGLELLARRTVQTLMPGLNRSQRTGSGQEFSQYRSYQPGDDLRRLDWNVYARTDRPYIKLLEDEEDLAVHLLLDTSASMDWPNDGEYDPDSNKLLYSKRLMAGLAYIGLTTNDRVMVTTLTPGGRDFFGPAQGRGQGGAVYTWRDTQVQADTTYTYWLEEIELNESTNEYGPATAAYETGAAGREVFLPFVIR